jgi:tetratricopeptide (TPR) repeat protein
LEGNLAVTKTWLVAGLPEVARVCRRIAIQASRRGWDHFVAIARHNVGLLDRRMGRLSESRQNLELAAHFWEELGKNPHSDNSELVQTLLALGDIEAAEVYAERALRNTAPWQRPYAEAVISRASVDLYRGDFGAATARLEPLLDDPDWMGALSGTARATLIEAYYLDGTARQEVEQAERILLELPSDPRDEPANAVTDAIAAHLLGDCRGACSRVQSRLEYWSSKGATRD